MPLREAHSSMKPSETIYGMHAVRVMLERHPDRVITVRLAEQRDDPRARAIEELARRHQRPVHLSTGGVVARVHDPAVAVPAFQAQVPLFEAGTRGGEQGDRAWRSGSEVGDRIGIA